MLDIEPRRVFYYFEKLAAIPHGSTNTKAVSDYIVDVAEELGLICYQDDSNNVIIYKAGQGGGEDAASVIIQGHMDMVCEKEDGCDIDFEKDGLRLVLKDNLLSAEGTTLGGDDGIAVAYMLAILEDTEMTHPPLECVFTVDEEIGMLGATALDTSRLMGKTLLNIDSEEEGNLLVSCAGGATATLTFPIIRRGAQGDRYKLTLSGFKGGHSGVEIDKGRANADIVLGSVLKDLLYEDDSLRIVGVKGGLKDNAIPVRAEAVILTKRAELISDKLTLLLSDIKKIYGENDPEIVYSFEEAGDDEYSGMYPLDELQSMNLIMLLGSAPNGVRKMSEDIEGLVQTSLNLGIMYTTENEVVMSFSVRSSVGTEKAELLEELDALIRSIGGSMSVEGSYPAWEYRKDSPIRDIMTETYEEMYGRKMEVQAIHAGLECGIFSGAIPGLDAVSFGPDIYDIHTPSERMDTDSVLRVWEYIKRVLEKCAEI